ncbi:hypothetical protein [Methanocalculus chunghsingensis]|uniref:hypothetical protein n=1 Tax=Methanocalculus chunghsingensis TaxID=156457 RepID=UPI001B8B6AB5|nr:hypothetical protein [Methanocalculus chunghsingensis]
MDQGVFSSADAVFHSGQERAWIRKNGRDDFSDREMGERHSADGTDAILHEGLDIQI